MADTSERRCHGTEMVDVGRLRGASIDANFCGSCGTRLGATAKFCSECGMRVDLASPSAEYKQVTVLFADVVHSMDIAAAVGGEWLRR